MEQRELAFTCAVDHEQHDIWPMNRDQVEHILRAARLANHFKPPDCVEKGAKGLADEIVTLGDYYCDRV